MSFWRLIRRSLLAHWRTHFAVALGVAAATAVLTGALAIGDSLRYSLKQLTLDRLGRIDSVLAGPHFFRAALAGELHQRLPNGEGVELIPAILLSATVQNTAIESRPLSGRVNLIGCDERFQALFDAPIEALGPDQIVLNRPLADRLRVSVGDEVVLRIGQAAAISPDSPLGRKSETIRNRPLTVAAIIPARGAGLFALRPSQQPPHNALVSIATLQEMLEQPERANAIFAARKTLGLSPADATAVAASPLDQPLADGLNAALRPQLADYGLAFTETPRGYWHLTSERMLLEDAVVAAAARSWPEVVRQEVFTYLANYIRTPDGRGKIPYSTVSALQPQTAPPLGPLTASDGAPLAEIGNDQIVLNRPAADDLAQQGVVVKPGDPIELVYFEPESTHGQVREKTATLRLQAIVEMAGAAADRDLTPELAGVTDQASIANWDPPFPYDAARVRSTPPNNQDDAYWQQYKATPKAFVSLATGRRLWSSRFGQSTSLRVPKTGSATREEMVERLQLDPAELGLAFTAVRAQGLAAAAGTTPFDALFLGFSLFIVASAVMLIALLFRLGVENRASEVGILLATGWRRRRVAAALAAQGLIVSLVGGALGLAIGLAYARAMLFALQSPQWWLAAIATPFLEFHARTASLAIGYAAGVVISGLTILWTLRGLGKTAVRRLLAGQADDELLPHRAPRRWTSAVIAVLLIAAPASAMAALTLGGEAQAGAFFAAGACVLAALLLAIGQRMRSASGSGGRLTLARLAARNGARNPGRSTLSIGLVATASFLIVATSAFRVDPSAAARGKSGGAGGFDLVAESAQPIYANLNSASGRADLGLSGHAAEQLVSAQVYSLRLSAGDDSSCLNLYQTSQPRTLGASSDLIDRGGFAWASSAAETPAEKENPWRLLQKQLPDKDGMPTVPALFDFNTAMYGLHLWKGVGQSLEITDGRGRRVRLQVVGLLKNSILQGDAIVAEDQFLAMFPDTSGYRYFLIESPSGAAQPLARSLDDALGDFGLESEPAIDRLSRFMAVQNTYLLTFQSLGGLGLMLGTFGLAAVQLRNVLERRGELALLRAAGFRRRRLAGLVLIEHGLLLLGGLGVGIIAALLTVVPHWFVGGAVVPWGELARTLALVLGVGLVAGAIAVRGALAAELLPALRSE